MAEPPTPPGPMSKNPSHLAHSLPDASDRFRIHGALLVPFLSLCLFTGLLVWLLVRPDHFEHGGLIWLAAGCAAIGTLLLGHAYYAHRVLTQARAEIEQHRYAMHTTLPQLRVIWEQSPLSITLFDPHDPVVPLKIVDCNPMACEIHGYTREELIGQSIDLLEAHPWAAQGSQGHIEDL